ncbi:MAG: type II toxin-antitoxin system prevent-host-death family antitoxin [Bacteroidota bacterium]
MLAKCFGSAVYGVKVSVSTIEVDVGQGQRFYMVDLPDSAVNIILFIVRFFVQITQVYYLSIMEITTYSNFRQNLKSFMDKVFETRSPLFVTRSNGEDIVVLSKEDYDGIQETLHLLSSPKNAQRLKESIKELNKGDGTKRDLSI